MKKVNPATANHNRYRLMIYWRVGTKPGFTFIALDADTVRAAKREVIGMSSKDWYLARILERQNDGGVIDVDAPDDFRWLYRPVLEWRAGEWRDATDNKWSGEIVTYHANLDVWTNDLTCDAAREAHMLGCAE